MCLDDGAEWDDQTWRIRRSAPDRFGAEYRRQLLLLNRERIEFSYEKARVAGLEAPIILVLDLQDDRAACLSHRLGISWEQIEECRTGCRDLEVVPVHVAAVPPCTAICLVGPTTPKSPQGIVKPCPTGTFRVIAVAAGGNSFADFPLPPESRLDQDGSA